MESTKTVSKEMNEKRKHPKFWIRLPSFCYCLTSRASFYCAFENISIEGMCLVDIRYLALNELIEFKINLPGGTVHCKGKIIWFKNQPGSKNQKAGIKFTYLDSKNRDLISDFITDMKSI